ncbi:alpha/beta fold hydrolase [Actinoplanes sp. NPDC049599]|uniref:alpha/beta fold hydrolase n=1 Tax=Actinoplanes sp. NPDC049599 TaxID=3363903 RepID=UPI0037B53824
MSAVLRHQARRAAVVGSVLTIVCGGLIGAAPAHAADPPGTVLTQGTATVPGSLAVLADAKRISYTSTNVTGGAITVTGLVLTPKTNKISRTVVWGHGTTGLADQCAPSNNLGVFWPEAEAAIGELLSRGWTVTAPDYQGLGTPEAHPYLVGGSEARAMIDSVKAARQLDSSLSNQYVLDGHSQGGQAALFAGELAPFYDGPLTLRGVAAIAPASNVDLLAPLIPGTPGQGYLVMALYGLAAVQPSFDPMTVLATQAQQRVPVLQSGCLLEILAQYQSLQPRQLLTNGALPSSVVDQLAHYANPAQAPSTAPILLVQGTADEAVPYDITAGVLFPQLDAYDQPVTLVTLEGENHDGAVVASVETVANWIATRFTG